MKQTVLLYSGKDKNMAGAVKHAKLRNGVYQYIRRVPEAVKRQPVWYEMHFNSRPTYRVSLRTKDQAIALRRCYNEHMAFERKLAAIGGLVQDKAVPQSQETEWRSPRVVTQADLYEIAERFRELEIVPIERAHIRADASPEHAAEYDRMVYELERDAEQTGKVINDRGSANGKLGSPSEWATWVIRNDNFDAPAGSEAYGAIVGAIRSGMNDGRKHVQSLLEGHGVPRLRGDKRPERTSVPTLAEAVDEYLKLKKLPTRTESEVKSSLSLFEKFCGVKRLDALERRDFQNFAKYLAGRTIGEKSTSGIVRPPSLATVKKRIGLLRAVINHAIYSDKFAGPNPAGGIKVEAYVAKPNRAVMPEKRRLTVSEMNLIFQHPWFTGCASESNTHAPGSYRLKGSEYWVPVVAALTGCRASELGGLMLTEVILEQKFPHLIIRDNMYRRTKGGYSRKVPIINALKELGFSSYVQEVRDSGADRLFPDWLAPKGKDTGRNDDKAWSNGKIMRGFNRTVIPSMIGHLLLPGARQAVTFHSLRGAFKAMLGSAEYRLHPNIINEVIGHTKGELDNRYIGEIPIEETYPAIKDCYYIDLVIPKLERE